MQILELTLEGFRNYGRETAAFDPDCNVIFGENAQGKTNLLEAVTYLSMGRSFRTRREQELIGMDASFADLQAEVRRGQKVYPGTIDAGDVDAIEVAEAQGAELHAVNPIARYEDASRDELTVYRVPVDVFLVPIDVFLLSEEDFDVLDIGPDGDDEQMVVFFQQGFGCRDAYLAVPPDARDDEMPIRQLHNLLDAFVIDGGIADSEFRHVGFHIFRCLGRRAL